VLDKGDARRLEVYYSLFDKILTLRQGEYLGEWQLVGGSICEYF